MKLSSLFTLLLLPPLTWVWIKMECVGNIVLYLQTSKEVLTFNFQKASNSGRGILSGQGRRWFKVVNCWMKVTFIHWTKFTPNIHRCTYHLCIKQWLAQGIYRCIRKMASLASWHPQSKGQDLLENIRT